MRRPISFNSATRTSAGLTSSTKQQQKDKAMPKDLPGRRQHCIEGIGRPSPTSSPYQSGKEENLDADAVGGLLEIANTDLVFMDPLEEVGDEGGIDEDNNEYGWG